MNPGWVQRQLYDLYVALPVAQDALAAARDGEVEAKHSFEAARRRAIFDCPYRVARGGYTTADRDAWVDDQVADLRFEYDKKTAMTLAAQDHLRTLRDQAEIMRSLGVSVRLDAELAAIGQPG